MSETYKEYLETVKSEQSGLSKDQIKDQMEQQSEYAFDLDNFPSVSHNFIQRGIVISCEGAGHPSHRHFLKRQSA
jgi:hypothetical protein